MQEFQLSGQLLGHSKLNTCFSGGGGGGGGGGLPNFEGLLQKLIRKLVLNKCPYKGKNSGHTYNHTHSHTLIDYLKVPPPYPIFRWVQLEKQVILLLWP